MYPLVSIITIVYNGEKNIEKTIKSVINQTYRNVEYIIIDGGSTDSTINIINKYRNEIDLVISEADNGISDAFNKGLRRVSGEIIGIINADDWYDEDAIEKVVRSIKNVDIVYGDLRLWKKDKLDFVLKGDHRHLEQEMTLNHPTVFVRKKWYDQFGLFDEAYKCAMDYDIMLRFKVNNCLFGYIPEVLANMQWGGFSDKKWMQGCRETLIIKNKYLPDNRLRNRLYFYKHFMGIALPRLLIKLHFNFLIKVYRTRFAKLKKIYR
jgi:glycosyltransferase involved in cell wall biosynthesis